MPAAKRLDADIEKYIDQLQATIQDNRFAVEDMRRTTEVLTDQLRDAVTEKEGLLVRFQIMEMELVKTKADLVQARINFDGLGNQYDLLKREKEVLAEKLAASDNQAAISGTAARLPILEPHAPMLAPPITRTRSAAGSEKSAHSSKSSLASSADGPRLIIPLAPPPSGKRSPSKASTSHGPSPPDGQLDSIVMRLRNLTSVSPTPSLASTEAPTPRVSGTCPLVPRVAGPPSLSAVRSGGRSTRFPDMTRSTLLGGNTDATSLSDFPRSTSSLFFTPSISTDLPVFAYGEKTNAYIAENALDPALHHALHRLAQEEIPLRWASCIRTWPHFWNHPEHVNGIAEALYGDFSVRQGK